MWVAERTRCARRTDFVAASADIYTSLRGELVSSNQSIGILITRLVARQHTWLFKFLQDAVKL